MKKIFSNEQIYSYTNLLYENFLNNESLILPIKANFYLHHNLNKFTEIVKSIEEVKTSIAKKYGNFSTEKNTYLIDKNNIEKAQEELNKLFELEHSIDISMITLQDLEDIQLTTKQMQALYFMIEA